MYDVTLLSSFHINHGNCNYRSLYKIIDNIQPEIIFEELPVKVFQHVYSRYSNPQSLEAIAIKLYLQTHHIQHFPVDTLPKDMDNLFDAYEIIEQSNPEYKMLFQRHMESIKELGFNYLNSDECTRIIERIKFFEISTLKELNELDLMSKYDSDLELDDKREDEMLQNIYDISRSVPYKKALFICGAEHRIRIWQKLKRIGNTFSPKLSWNLYA